MPPISLRFYNAVLLVALCNFSSGVSADDCVNFTNRSIQQQDANLFNLCGYRGSQWASSTKRLVAECRAMSKKDRIKRLAMRDKLLASCPVAADTSSRLSKIPSVGRNRQQRLLTVLLSAIRRQDENLVRSIINAGVNLGVQPAWMGESPLFLAIELGNYHLARILVRAGARPYSMASGEINPISLLLQDGPTNHAFLEFLLQNKANPNLSGKEVDAELPIVLAATKGDFRAVDILLRFKADTNLYNEYSAIQKAVEQDHYPMARALIKSGANPNLGIDGEVCNGQLVLDIAYRSASERVIDLLLDNRGLTELECQDAVKITIAKSNVPQKTEAQKSKPKSRNR